MSSKVGEAYVLVHTRTRPLTPAQKRLLAGEGAKAGDAWTSAFGKKVMDRTREEMAKSSAALEEMMERTFATGDFDSVRKEFGSVEQSVRVLTDGLEDLQKQGKLNKREFALLQNSMRRWAASAEEADRKVREIAERDAVTEALRKEEEANRRRIKATLDRLTADIKAHDKMNTLREKEVSADLAAFDKMFAAAEKHVQQIEGLREKDEASAQKHETKMAEREARLIALFEKRANRVEEVSQKHEDKMAARDAAGLARFERSVQRFEDLKEREVRAVERATIEEEEWLARRLGMHRRHLSDLSDAYRENLGTLHRVFEQNEDGATRFTRVIRRTNRQLSLMPDIAGTLFGRGSRNNLLNFIGSVVRNVASIPVVLSKAFTGIIDKIASTTKAFGALRASTGSTSAALGTLVRAGLPALGATLASLAVAVITAAYAIPALASAISMLAGVFTAWVSVLSTAIAGMLVPLVPLLGVLAGAFVGLAIPLVSAFTEISKANEEGEKLTGTLGKMQTAVNDFKRDMKDFSRTVLPEAARGFTILAGAASAFLEAAGPGLDQGLRRFNNILSSSQLEDTLAAWRDSIPEIVSDFTAGLGHMLAGLLRFFEPILPYVERMSQGFYDMMLNFNAWAGSFGGQNTIAEWMDRAWTAATTLWDILGNVWNILGSIFNMGTDSAGQGFLSHLESITAEFAAWLDTDGGRDAVTEWFEDAAEFGEKLWEIIGDIGDTFDALDTQSARDNLQKFLSIVEDLVEKTEDVANFFGTLERGFEAWLTGSTQRPSGGTDVGAMLGLGEEDAREYAKTFTDSFDEQVMRWVFGDKFVDTIKKADAAIAEAGAQAWEDFLRGWNRLLGMGEALWENITSVDTWKDLGRGAWNLFLEGLQEMITPHDWIQGWARDAFQIEDATWGEIASALWTGLANGIQEAAETYIAEPFRRLIDQVKEIFGIASPSTVFMQIGRDIVQGLIDGIAEWWNNLIARVTEWGNSFVEAVSLFFSMLPGRIGEWLGQAWEQVSSWFGQMWTSATTWISQTVTDVVTWISGLPSQIGTWLQTAWTNVQTWFESMRNTASTKAQALVDDAIAWIQTLPGRVVTWLQEAWLKLQSKFELMRATASEKASALVNDAVNALSSLPGRAASALSTLASKVAAPFREAYDTAKGWWDRIKALISGGLSVPVTTSPMGGSSSRWQASGGLFSSPQIVGVGEAGPEAIIPLSRPLSMVDPSVRPMAAALRGESVSTSRVVNVQPGAIVLRYSGQDPMRAAESFLDGLALSLP